MSLEDPSDSATARSATPTFERIEHVLDRFLAVADVDKVFGEPVRHGETLVIPTAEVVAGMGFGMGSGQGSESEGERRQGGGGGGGGGGGSVIARSVAVVVASPDGVRVEPVVDSTKIALAALTAAGFMLASWLGMSRPKR